MIFLIASWELNKAIENEENKFSVVLQSLAELKARNLSAKRRAMLSGAAEFTHDQVFMDDLYEWVQQSMTDDEISRRIRSRLTSIRDTYNFQSVILLDEQGQSRLVVGNVVTSSFSHYHSTNNIATNTKVRLSEPYIQGNTAPPNYFIDIVIPLIRQVNLANKVIGTLVIQDKLSHFFNLPGELLIGNDYLNIESFLIFHAGENKFVIPDKGFSTMTINSTLSEDIGNDGALPSLYKNYKLDDGDWQVLVKMEQRDIIDSLQQRAYKVIWISLAILIITALTIFFLLRQMTYRFLLEKIESLNNSEKKLQDIIDLIPAMIFVKDPDSRIILMNEACEEQWGIVFSEGYNTEASKAFLPGQVEAFEAKDREAFAKRELISFEEVVWSEKFKQNRDVHTLKKPVFDSAGYPLYLICLSYDISEAKLKEQALKQSEDRLKEAQALAHIGSWEMDIEHGGALIWSEEVYRIYGKDPLCFNPTYENVIASVYPDDRILVDKIFYESVQEKKDFSLEHRLLLPDGYIKWVCVRSLAIYDSKGNPVRVIGTVQDINDRKKIENDLYNSQQRLAFHIENTPLAVIEYDLDFKVIAWNPAAERIFGYKHTEAIGQSALCIVPAEAQDEVKQIFTLLLKREGGFHSINSNLRKDGSSIICQWHNTPLVDEKKNVCGVASMVHDITEKEHEHRYLVTSLEENKSLLRELHHRVKNNLQLISSMLSLKANTLIEKETREPFVVSQQRIHTIALLYDQFYENNIINSKVLLCNYLNKLVSTIEQLETNSRVKVVSEIVFENIPVDFDLALPCGLIVNELVTNSIKHAFPNDHSGTVRIGLSRRSQGGFCIWIEDNGVGISRDINLADKQHLGLRLVDLLVKQIHARMKVASEQGLRYEFEVDI